MIEWIKQLTPEFYIVIGFLLVLFILLIIQIIRLTLVARRLGTQDFKIIESIAKNNEGEYFLHITVSNQAFSTNNLNDIGFKNKDIIHVLSTVNKLIPSRNKHVESLPMQHIESITIVGKKKYKKLKIYAENDLGDKKLIKAKVTNKYLKRRFKQNKKAEKLAAKKERFTTGNYNVWERTGLILRLFGRPIYKLFRKLNRKTNYALRENEVRRQQKAEHDKIENDLNITTAKVRSIQIAEESKKINKTRETELELLKQKKVLEIETLKQEEYNKAFETRKAEIDAIVVNDEIKKHFDKNPIDYEAIDAKILKEKEIKVEPVKEDKEVPKEKEEKPLEESQVEPKKQRKGKKEPKEQQETLFDDEAVPLKEKEESTEKKANPQKEANDVVKNGKKGNNHKKKNGKK